MANYTVTIFTIGTSTPLVNPESITVSANDTVTFVHERDDPSIRSVSVSGLSSAVWTNNASFSLSSSDSSTASVTRTIKASPTLGGDIITIQNAFEDFVVNVVASSVDKTPNTLSLGSNVTNAELSTAYYTSTATVAGMDSGQSATITLGATNTSQIPRISKNGGAYTTGSVSVVNGDTLKFEVYSFSVGSTTTTLTVIANDGTADETNIGTFTVTTRAADNTPDAFSLGSNVTNASTSTYYYTNTATVTGMDSGSSATIALSLTNSAASPAWSKNGGAWSTGSFNVSLNDTVQFRVLSSSSQGVTSTLTITANGGANSTFTVSTVSPDTTPNAFTLGTVSNQTPGTWVYSNTITVSGINTTASCTLRDVNYLAVANTKNYIQYSKNGGSYSGGNDNFTVVNGDTLRVRVVGFVWGASVVARLSIGGVTSDFTAQHVSKPGASGSGIITVFPKTAGQTIWLGADVAAFFGGTAPHNISEYYRGGSYVQNITKNNGVPTSGAIDLTDFIGSGKSNYILSYPTVLSGSYSGVNDYTLSLSFSGGTFGITGDIVNNNLQWRVDYATVTYPSYSGSGAISYNRTSGTWYTYASMGTFTITLWRDIATTGRFGGYLIVYCRDPSDTSTYSSVRIPWYIDFTGDPYL